MKIKTILQFLSNKIVQLCILIFFPLLFGILENWFDWGTILKNITFIPLALWCLTWIIFALIINPIKSLINSKKDD